MERKINPYTLIFKQLYVIFNCPINIQCIIIIIKFVKDEYVNMLHYEHRLKIEASALGAKDHKETIKLGAVE